MKHPLRALVTISAATALTTGLGLAGPALATVHKATGTGPPEQVCHRGPGDRQPVGQRVIVVEPVVIGGQVPVVVTHEALACQTAAAGSDGGAD